MKSFCHRLATLAAITALGLAGCAGEPTIQTGEDAETMMGTLNRVDNARVSLAYVDPTVDYRRFTGVLLMPLGVDNIEILQPASNSSAVNRFNREWELSDQDRENLRAIFAERVSSAISNGGHFELSDEPGPDVLAVTAMITRIAPSAPRDDASSRAAGRSRVYTASAGSISVAMALSDSVDGEILAIIKDTRGSQSDVWQVNNRVTNMAEVRRIFSTWGQRLDQGLARLREMTPVTE